MGPARSRRAERVRRAARGGRDGALRPVRARGRRRRSPDRRPEGSAAGSPARAPRPGEGDVKAPRGSLTTRLARIEDRAAERARPEMPRDEEGWLVIFELWGENGDF